MEDQIIKYFSGELSSEERIRLLVEIQKDPALKKEIAAYQNMYASIQLHPDCIDRNAGEISYRKIQRKRKKENRQRIFYRTFSYVAVSLIAFFIGKSIYNYPTDNYKELSVSPGLEVYIPPGQRGRILLPDGTVAWLNAGSTLSYPAVFDKERRISLSGEGWFDVATDEKRPFIVSTKDIQIEALGTQFNVYSYENAGYAITSLLEGKVKVTSLHNLSNSVILHPDEQAYYEGEAFSVSAMTNKDVLLWQEGVYSFRKEPMESLLAKLELYYDTRIIVKNPEIFRFEYTGKFRQQDGVIEILRLIQKIHPFNITEDKDLNQITLDK